MNRLAHATSSFAAQAWSRPIGVRGGDFVILHRTRWGLRTIVGDVSGHGEEASGAAECVRRRISQDVDMPLTPWLLSTWNEALMPGLEGRFVCLTICDAFDRSRRIALANCGNPPVLVRRRNGVIEPLESRGTVLGIVGPRDWTAPNIVNTRIARNERVFCFTDGVTEHFNDRHELFGIERVSTVMSHVWNAPIRALRRYMQSFSGMAARFCDDVTVVLVQ